MTGILCRENSRDTWTCVACLVKNSEMFGTVRVLVDLILQTDENTEEWWMTT